MANVYNRFVPRAPDARVLGARLLGDPRGVMQKVPVSKPNVPALFRNSYAARSSISQPAPYGLVTSNGHGLSGFAGFGNFAGFGAVPLFDEFEWDESWAAADFVGQNPTWVRQVNKQMDVLGIKDTNYPAVSYTPTDPSLVSQAGLKWGQIRAASSRDAATRAFANEVRGNIKAAIAQADQATKQQPVNLVFGRRTGPAEQMRVAAFESIQNEMERILAYRIPAAGSANTGGGASPPLQSENQGSNYGGNTGGGSSMADRLAPLLNSQPMPGSPAPSSSKLPYIIGGVALIGVGAFLFLRKK